MSKFIITDLDGTVANISHRLPLICDVKDGKYVLKSDISKATWDEFNRLCVLDKPIMPIIHIVKSMYRQGFNLVVCSSRSDMARKETEEWWWENIGVPVLGGIHLRPEHDNVTTDVDLKRNWAQVYQQGIVRETLFVLEDRGPVVEMWRELGLTCLQVKDGDIHDD